MGVNTIMVMAVLMAVMIIYWNSRSNGGGLA